MRQASNVILCARRPSAERRQARHRGTEAAGVVLGEQHRDAEQVRRLRRRRRALATAAAPSSIAGIRRGWKSMISSAERSRSIVSIIKPSIMAMSVQYLVSLTRRNPYRVCESDQSLVHVPDVGGQFPLIVDLAPDDDVLSGDVLRRIALRLEAECADFARRIRPERLHIDSGQPCRRRAASSRCPRSPGWLAGREPSRRRLEGRRHPRCTTQPRHANRPC